MPDKLSDMRNRAYGHVTVKQGWFGRWKLVRTTVAGDETLGRSTDRGFLEYLAELYRAHNYFELTDVDMDTDPLPFIAAGINAAQDYVYAQNREMGWWDNVTDETVPVKLCLIHSEISEAMEGHRKGLMDDHLPDLPMIEVELADAMVREIDLGGHLGAKLGTTFVRKLIYNKARADHQRENRAKAGGKVY